MTIWLARHGAEGTCALPGPGIQPGCRFKHPLMPKQSFDWVMAGGMRLSKF